MKAVFMNFRMEMSAWRFFKDWKTHCSWRPGAFDGLWLET